MISALVLTPIPSPYHVELFDAIEATGSICLRILYAAPSFPDRSWKVPKIHHDHRFMVDMSTPERQDEVLLPDLVIFSGYNSLGFMLSGYNSLGFGKLISKRHRSGKPWVFWGERPGYLIPTYIGSLYRKLAFSQLHQSKAPVWGIGRWATDTYRNELDADRLYLNVPYFSDLGPYLAIRRDWIESTTCRFMFSGSFVRRKGVHLLASAFAKLRNRGHDAELHLVGDGRLMNSLRIRTSPVADRVHFHGFQQWRDLPRFYANADVLCAPSLYDGWGMIVPEGLAAGMPVISTNMTGAAKELITKGCGWLVPADDEHALLGAMVQAATLPAATRNEMSENARRAAQKQNVKAGVQRFCQACELSFSEWKRRKPISSTGISSPL